jgi:hypothetical protein
LRISLGQVEKDLTDYLAANLPSGIVAARVSWPNAPFTTPTNLPWLRASIASPVRIDKDAANSFRIYQGFFYIDVFHPKKTGSVAAMTTAEAIALSFDGAAMPYTVCLSAEPEVIGSEEDTPWYHVQVICLYQYQSITGV